MTPFLLCSYFRAHPTTLLLKTLGGRMHGPPPQIFGGTFPPVFLGLRPCSDGIVLIEYVKTDRKCETRWAPQPGTASLLNFAFLTEPLRLRFFLTLRLLCLT